MSKHLILTFFLFLCFNIYNYSQAQVKYTGMEFHSDYGLLYPIHLKKYDYYQLKKLKKNIGAICREKPDTIPYGDLTYLSSNLPYEGAFLLVYVKGFQVYTEVLVNFPWQIKQVFYPYKGGLMALDKNNRPIADLRMSFDWEGMPYDSLAQTYTFSNITSSGAITVSNGKMKQKFELYNNPSGYRGNQSYTVSGVHYTGFLVKSKPMYKHGDTLKTKFYICEDNGIPYTGDATIKVYRVGASTIERKISPVSPGAFLFNDVVTDSFRLDHDFPVEIFTKNGQEVISTNFRVEEYKLRETEYSFEPLSSVYYPDDSLYIMADARDRNDNIVYDAKVDVVVTLGTVDKIYTKYVHVPETLYKHTYTMLEISNGILQLPSFLKDRYLADYSVNVNANFTNSNNEIKEFKKSVKISYAKKPFRHYISKGYIHFIKNSDASDSVTIVPHYGTRKRGENQKIAFTDSLLIDPLVQFYSLSTPSLYTSLTLSSDLLPVSVNGKLKHDTLFLTVKNPDRLPLYMYYVADEEIKSFDPAREKFILMPGKKPVYVYWEYTTSTFRTVKTRSYSIRDKDILLTHDLPDKVYPGQEMKVNIHTTDIKNNPLEGTNVTFFSYNAAFTNPDVPTVPDFNHDPGVANTSVIGTLYAEAPAKMDFNLDTAWFSKFHLDENLHYSTLYSQDSITIKKVPVENSEDSYVKIFGINQFKEIYQPEVVKENNKIVYYNGGIIDHITTTPGQHSWMARFGKNTVKIDNITTGTDSVTFVFVRLDKKHVVSTDTNFTALKNELKQTYIYLKNKDYKYSNLRYYDAHHTYTVSTGQKDEYYIGPFDNLSDLYVDCFEYNQAKTMYNTIVPGFRNAFVKGGFVVQDTTKEIFPFNIKQQNLNFYTTGIVSQHLRKKAWEELHTDKLYGKFTYNYNDYYWYHHNEMHVLQSLLASQAMGTILINLTKGNVYKSRGKTVNFEGLERGTYKIIYIDKNLEPIIEDTFVIEEQGQHYMVLDKELSFGNGTELNNIYFSKEGPAMGRLKGQVMDKDGKPISYARIILRKNGEIVHKTHTNLEGVFDIQNGTAERDFTMEISSIGYGSVSLGRVSFYAKDSLHVIIPLGVRPLSQAEIIHKYKRRYGYSYGEASVYADMSPVFVTGNSRSADVNREDLLYSRSSSTTALESVMVNSVSGVSAADIFIDGVKVRESETEVSDILGGIPAKYGDAPGGVINIGKFNNTNTQPEIITLELNTIRSAFSDNAIWQPNLITNAQGTVSCDIKFPDNITAWNSYILAMHKDGLSAQLMTTTKSFKPVTATLYIPEFVIEGDSFEVVNKVMNYTSIPVTTSNRLLVGEVTLPFPDTIIKDFFIRKTTLLAIPADSMTISFSTSMTGGYMDGEKRTLPVYKKGINIEKGRVFPVWKDTEITADSLLPDQEVNVEIYNGFDDLVTKEADYLLFTYVHGCNEQMSSKLIAAICAANISQKKWKKDLYAGQAKKMIRLLEKNQNEQGGWSWWHKGKTSVFMTLKVAEAFKFAEDNGYKIDLNTSVEKAIPGLLSGAANRDDTLSVMKVAGLYGIEKEKIFDLKTIYTLTVPKNQYQELQVVEIKQLYGIPADIPVLMGMKKETLLGNYYWGKNGYSIYDNATYMTGMMLEILQREKVGQDTLIKLIGYMMEKRYNGHFTNTMASAKMSMFFNKYTTTTGKTDPYIVVNKKDTVMIKDSYTQLHFPEVSSIQIHTDRLLYAGYSQEVSLPYEAVKTDNFTLETDWTQDDRKVTTITSGKYVKLHTRVKVHKDATYVSLEIPIPAGCTYAEKPQPVSNYYSSSGEVYREYFKDRVVVYYEKLPAGWYDLYFKLEPRFRGNYTVNNSLMESMYFPQLNGYNALQKVRIK